MPRATAIAISTDPQVAASQAGLRHVDDAQPGIRRRKTRAGFRYVLPDGRPLRDAEALARIRSLAIPPAYTDVWICLRADGHLQATGRDARGRKQYRYHPQWRALRDSTKYHRMIAFGHALPKIRRRVARDLRRPALSREQVLATVVRLLELTLIRVGNEAYARSNRSFGLTTLRDRHVKVSGGRLWFRFRGKGGQRHEIALDDARLARIVRRCRELPGQELFQYRDETGDIRSIDSSDINGYLRDITGEDFTAKDFRTWAGTVLAATALAGSAGFDSEAQAKREVVSAIEAVSCLLGNTPAICRRCYVHPGVIDAYLDRSLVALLEAGEPKRGLYKDEIAVMALLKVRSRVARPVQSGRPKASRAGTHNRG